MTLYFMSKYFHNNEGLIAYHPMGKNYDKEKMKHLFCKETYKQNHQIQKKEARKNISII